MGKKYVHIIEYQERGSMWRLVNGLEIYDNHVVLETKGKYVKLSEYDKETIFIFHTSGKNFPMINSLMEFLEDGKKCAVFIHTLPDYIIEKGFGDFLNYIKMVTSIFQCKVMVPSNAAKKMFATFDIKTEVVNLGIPSIKLSKKIDYIKLDKYTNKIITVSTKNTKKYKMAKGIDRFYELMRISGKEKEALILGNDCIEKIENIKLPHDEFIYVLSKAKLYIQLSRSESYNISAIEAKQLKIPVLVSNSTGHIDSVRDDFFRVKSIAEANMKLYEILKMDDFVKKKIGYNYYDSIINDSIIAFKKRLEDAIQDLV